MRFHGRFDEARRLAQDAYDLTTRIGDSYVRAYAAGQLARAALDLDDIVDGKRQAVETLGIAHRLRNSSAMSYALELWATAELREGNVERAAERFALGERGFRQTGSEPWHTEGESRDELAEELSAALGERYERILADAREGDFDDAVERLLGSGSGDGDADSRTT